MKQFLLGAATSLFFAAFLLGFFWLIHHGNSTYPSVVECMLAEMQGRPVAMMGLVRKTCEQRANNADSSKLMTDEEAWGSSSQPVQSNKNDPAKVEVPLMTDEQFWGKPDQKLLTYEQFFGKKP